jgi:hypothetical protein
VEEGVVDARRSAGQIVRVWYAKHGDGGMFARDAR